MNPEFEGNLDPTRPYDVVCFGAHPDDVEMAVGGTVAAWVESGHRVALVAWTRGELGTHGDAETRLREQAQAADVLGVDWAVYDRGDGRLQDDLATRHEAVRVLRALRPRLVIAPYPYTRAGAYDGRANVDHIACGLVVREATKLVRLRRLMPELEPHMVRRLLYYMVPDAVPPTFLVDVSAHEEKIRRGIESYASQMAIRRGSRSILDILMVMRQHTGIRAGLDLAEAFVSEDPLSGSASTLLEI